MVWGLAGRAAIRGVSALGWGGLAYEAGRSAYGYYTNQGGGRAKKKRPPAQVGAGTVLAPKGQGPLHPLYPGDVSGDTPPGPYDPQRGPHSPRTPKGVQKFGDAFLDLGTGIGERLSPPVPATPFPPRRHGPAPSPGQPSPGRQGPNVGQGTVLRPPPGSNDPFRPLYPGGGRLDDGMGNMTRQAPSGPSPMPSAPIPGSNDPFRPLYPGGGRLDDGMGNMTRQAPSGPSPMPSAPIPGSPVASPGAGTPGAPVSPIRTSPSAATPAGPSPVAARPRRSTRTAGASSSSPAVNQYGKKPMAKKKAGSTGSGSAWGNFWKSAQPYAPYAVGAIGGLLAAKAFGHKGPKYQTTNYFYR